MFSLSLPHVVPGFMMAGALIALWAVATDEPDRDFGFFEVTKDGHMRWYDDGGQS